MDELPNPITRSEQYLAKIAGAEPTLPTPITREERYLAKIAGEDVDIPPAPITRTEQYLAAIVEGGGGVEVEALTATQNKTYTAPEGKAYSPVTVNVSGGGGNSGVEADYRGLSYAYIDGTGIFRSSTEKENYMNAFRCAGGTKYIIFPPEISHNRFRVAYFYNKSYSDFESYIEAAGEAGTLIYNSDEYSIRDGVPILNQPYVITPAQDGELMIVTDNQSTTAPAYLLEALS